MSGELQFYGLFLRKWGIKVEKFTFAVVEWEKRQTTEVKTEDGSFRN